MKIKLRFIYIQLVLTTEYMYIFNNIFILNYNKEKSTKKNNELYIIYDHIIYNNNNNNNSTFKQGNFQFKWHMIIFLRVVTHAVQKITWFMVQI
jgi:hypothetical protein